MEFSLKAMAQIKLCEFCSILTGKAYKYLFIDGSKEHLWFEYVGQYSVNKSVLLCRTCHSSFDELVKVEEEVSVLRSKVGNAEQKREQLHHRLALRVVKRESINVSIAPRPETPLKGGKRMLVLSPQQMLKKADMRAEHPLCHGNDAQMGNMLIMQSEASNIIHCRLRVIF